MFWEGHKLSCITSVLPILNDCLLFLQSCDVAFSLVGLVFNE